MVRRSSAREKRLRCARRASARGKSRAYTPARAAASLKRGKGERERRKERRGGRGREQGEPRAAGIQLTVRPSADSAPLAVLLCSGCPPVCLCFGRRPLFQPSAHGPSPICSARRPFHRLMLQIGSPASILCSYSTAPSSTTAAATPRLHPLLLLPSWTCAPGCQLKPPPAD